LIDKNLRESLNIKQDYIFYHMIIKKHLKEIGEGAKGLLNEGKKAAYGIASKVEKTVTGEGGFIDDAKDLVGKVASEAKGVRTFVREKGGYGAAVKEGAGQIIDAVKGLYGNAEEDFKNTFYTNGKFDSQKAKDALKDKAGATGRFGKRAVRDISRLIADGARAVGEDYRDYIPSKEERAGIGDKYKGIVTREHLNECMAYESFARKKLPGGLKARPQILEDLKYHAATNADDLIKLYEKDSAAYGVVEKYLK
jgi:hypothetical protein